MPSDANIKLGVFSRTFERGTLREVLDAVAQHHFELVHLNLKSAGIDPFCHELDARTCTAIRLEIEPRGLDLVGVSCTFNAIHPDVAHRVREIELATNLITLARELGTSFASLSTGTRDPDDMWRAHPANVDASAWSDLRRALESLLEAAHAANVTLGIEPEPGNVVSSARRARRLLDELDADDLAVILDPANLLTVSTAPRQADVMDEALELLAADVHVVHAKDFSENSNCGAGLGLIDFELLFRLLERHRVNVPVLLHDLPEADVVRAQKHALAAARRTAADASTR